MIYFDHNASTPVRPVVIEAMREALSGSGANPSSAHRDGQSARAEIERAREQVARLVGAAADEVVFTSGGTEGDHAGIIGAAWASIARGRRVAISSVEHHAVHGAAEVLEPMGFAIDHLPVDAEGRVDPASIDALPADTVLVSVMLANNETGVVQPIRELAARAHARGLRFHCDAVQVAGKRPIDVAELGVDYLVISAHKLGGPKGAGALIVRRGAPFTALFRGSGHEKGRRGGTENLPGIVGFGVAAERALAELAEESARLMAMRERFETGLRARFPDVVIHGAGAERLPNTVNASFPGARSDHLLMALDSRGIAVSAGAACHSGGVSPSPVLTAMGVPNDLATSALRFSMGRTTVAEELDPVLAALEASVRAARALAPAGAGA